MTLWYGTKTTVFSMDREFTEFIDALGFSECVVIKLHYQQPLQIGAIDDFREVT